MQTASMRLRPLTCGMQMVSSMIGEDDGVNLPVGCSTSFRGDQTESNGRAISSCYEAKIQSKWNLCTGVVSIPSCLLQGFQLFSDDLTQGLLYISFLGAHIFP